MNRLTDKALKSGIREIFGGEVTVMTNKANSLWVTVETMYEYVDCSLKNLLKLADLVGTLNINIDESFMSGCETCDYGSSYTKEFHIAPDDDDEVNYMSK